jgi:hypothetical protein
MACPVAAVCELYKVAISMNTKSTTRMEAAPAMDLLGFIVLADEQRRRAWPKAEKDPKRVRLRLI